MGGGLLITGGDDDDDDDDDEINRGRVKVGFIWVIWGKVR